MMKKATVTLRESGYQFQVEPADFLAELAKHGDDPREYSRDIADFEWSDSEDDKPTDWPDNLPTWTYRPV